MSDPWYSDADREEDIRAAAVCGEVSKMLYAELALDWADALNKQRKENPEEENGRARD